MIIVDDLDNIVDFIDFCISLVFDHCVLIDSFTTNSRWEIVHDDSAGNRNNGRKIEKQWWWNDEGKGKDRDENKNDEMN